MSNYRRVKGPYRTYFFTVVTHDRQKILCEPASLIILRDALGKVRKLHPFRIDAWVLLPDHIHCIWTLPEDDFDYSKRWGMIKREFTINFQSAHNGMVGLSDKSNSRKKRRESTIWQRRFWEHTIRSQNDFNNHCDYIHYNPVKHALVGEPREWPHSTFHRFVEAGSYPQGWGCNVPENIKGMEME